MRGNATMATESTLLERVRKLLAKAEAESTVDFAP
jgi:hypothetical protein